MLCSSLCTAGSIGDSTQMPFYINHEVFKLILSFKDPTKQVGVKGGIQTDSAKHVFVEKPRSERLNKKTGPEHYVESPHYVNYGTIEHHGIGGRPYAPVPVSASRGGWGAIVFKHVPFSLNAGRYWDTAQYLCDIPPDLHREIRERYLSRPLNKPHPDLWQRCEPCLPDRFREHCKPWYYSV